MVDIKLPILELQYTKKKQMDKILEELFEVNYAKKEEEQQGEMLDLLQAVIGLVLMIDEESLKKVNGKHINKLQEREGTERGHNIIGYLHITS